MTNEDPCKFIVDLDLCKDIQIQEVDRNPVESMIEIAKLYTLMQQPVDKVPGKL